MKKNSLPKFSIMKYFYAIGILFSFMSCNAPSGVSRIWAIDDSEKIRQDDINNPLATDKNNAVWINNKINVFGGRNEIVAFQLIIQAGAPGANLVNLTISDLKNGNSTIPGSAAGPADPFDYRGRYV